MSLSDTRMRNREVEGALQSLTEWRRMTLRSTTPVLPSRSNQPDIQRCPNFLTMFVGGTILSHEQDPTCRCSNLELYYFRVVTLATRRNVEPRFLRIVGAPFSVVTFLDVTIPVLAPVTRRGFFVLPVRRWTVEFLKRAFPRAGATPGRNHRMVRPFVHRRRRPKTERPQCWAEPRRVEHGAPVHASIPSPDEANGKSTQGFARSSTASFTSFSEGKSGTSRRCGISGDRYRNPPVREHFLDERFIGRKVRDAFVPGSRYTRPLIRPRLNRISVERVLIGSGAAPRTEARATQREAVRLELWTGASK